jgi:hypothetical protein
LSLLEAIAASSSTAAEAIVRCKGVPEALLALLDMPVGSNTVSNSVTNSPSGNAAATQAGDAARSAAPQQHKTSSNRVAVLRLLRLLCASSPLACQLLRTAGLDTVVQMLLCSSSSGGGLVQQLMLLEALRIWMVSALHGVVITHMDVMFQFVAVLLQPPTPAAAAAAVAGSSSDEEATVRWQLTAAAYQLLDVLLRHALAVQGGAKTLGSQMISPGCAAAIAQEAASNWLNPVILSEVAQALVSLQDCQLPFDLNPNARVQGSGSDAGLGSGSGSGSGAVRFSSAEGAASQAAWLRVLAGLHPALLVPTAAAVLAGLSAVLGYLGSYWRSLQVVPQQLAAELLSQLQAAGLTDSSSSSSDGRGSSSKQEDAVPSLAHVLLTVQSSSSGAQQQQHQQQLGKALLQHCLELLAAAGGTTAAASDANGSALSIGGSSSRPLATHALASAAGSTVLAVCELQQQLQQLASSAPEQQQDQSSLGLAAAAAEVVSRNALLWVSAVNPSQTLALEPWRLAQYNMRQYQLRLLIKLAKPLLTSLQQQQQPQLLWRLVDGLLCVLPLSAPGQEAQALQALQLLFGPAAAAVAGQSGVSPPRQLLAAAQGALQQLQQQGGAVAAASAGVRADKLPPAADSYPYHPALLAAAAADSAGISGNTTADTGTVGGISIAQWCQTLLEGYAVTWLSVVAQRDEQQQPKQGSEAGKTPVVLPLPRVYVSEVEGSRLPVPPEWLMSEILALPASNISSSSSSGVSAWHPVSAALLLALGLEKIPSSCYMTAVRSSAKLEALLQLLYMFNAGELLGPVAQQQQQQQDGLGPAWQQADARWAAAALTQQYCADIVQVQQQQQQQHPSAATGAARQGDGGSEELVTVSQQLKASCPVHQILTSHLQQQQSSSSSSSASQTMQQLLLPSWSTSSAGSQLVDRLVRDLAELSMGDPMFASHVALLLLPAAGTKLQRAVWGCLQEQSSLHLLPPPERCTLGAAAYLGSYSSSSSSSGSCCPRFDLQLVGDMAKSLAQGDLKKSLQMGGLAGQLALQGIAGLCLDQQAWRDAPDTTSTPLAAPGNGAAAYASGSSSDSSVKPVSAAGMAVNVLRGVVRACPLEVLQQLLAVGQQCGVAVSEQGRALVQAAHGDAALMDKVQQLLAAVQ